MQRPSQLVNVDSLEWTDHTRKGHLLFRRQALGQATGGKQLGTSLYEVSPGQRLFIYHYHCANEEAMYVLEGTGVVRLPDGEHPIGKGDFLAFHRGAAGAHLVTAGPLRPEQPFEITPLFGSQGAPVP